MALHPPRRFFYPRPGLMDPAADRLLTTNLAFKQWGTIFPGAACVAALVDRFTESCHAVDIDADSWRQKRK